MAIDTAAAGDTIVTPRKRRVSRNCKLRDFRDVHAPVTPRKRRVSRNDNYLKEFKAEGKSRLARGV